MVVEPSPTVVLVCRTLLHGMWGPHNSEPCLHNFPSWLLQYPVHRPAFEKYPKALTNTEYGDLAINSMHHMNTLSLCAKLGTGSPVFSMQFKELVLTFKILHSLTLWYFFLTSLDTPNANVSAASFNGPPLSQNKWVGDSQAMLCCSSCFTEYPSA